MLQSCYTYKATSIKEKPLIVGKIYKIREDDKFVKSKMISTNDSVLTVMVGNVEKDIYTANIKEIKIQKFSAIKTVGLTLGVGLVLFGIIAAVSLSNMEFGGAGFGY
jgi:hypothetical protein